MLLKNNIVRKIRTIFNKIGCPVIVILKTSRAGEEVDNGCGMEFDLNEYAVIYRNSMNMNTGKKYYEWEVNQNISLMTFAADRCTSVEEMIEELNDVDGYEVVFRDEYYFKERK